MNPLLSYQNASWSLFLKIITTVGPLLACPNNLALADSAKTGSVSGIINFPGESVPKDIIVCAEEVINNNTICTNKKTKYGILYKYKMDVPAGIYHFYAITNAPDVGDLKGYKAYYTEFVVCGLKAECPSHRKVNVTVKAGSKIVNVDPQDWYELSKPST